MRWRSFFAVLLGALTAIVTAPAKTQLLRRHRAAAQLER
jgi:hypothetical protein